MLKSLALRSDGYDVLAKNNPLLVMTCAVPNADGNAAARAIMPAHPSYFFPRTTEWIHRHIPSRVFRWSVAALALLALAASPCVGSSRTTPSFSDASKKLELVSKDPSATREQWLDVINSFALIHASGKPNSVARRSLFHAGKGCLSLYRISGKPEDLDSAIRYLTDFHRDCRKGPYFIPTLQALKEAHILKRELEAKERCASVPATHPKAAPTGPTEAQKIAVDRSHEAKPAVVAEVQGLPTTLENSDNVQREQKNPAQGWNGKASLHAKPYAQGPPATPKKASTANQVASLPPTSASDAIPAAQTAKCPAKTFVVVIDPGHGGKDPGAVSTDGSLKEKDITLDVAKRFKTALEAKKSNVRVTLTREDDRSLSLQERTAIANSLNADLFVSVHCNADVDASSKGIETFFLDKANSPRAMRVAARENGIPLSKMSDLEATLLDLMMSSKKTESTELAKTMHGGMARALERSKFSVRNRGVKQAPFYVLVGAQMPAILVECAFISSNRALRTLTSPQYLGSVAEGLANGAALYLRGLGQEG